MYCTICRTHRVCSIHFLEGRPTDAHPDPELFLLPDASTSKPKAGNVKPRSTLTKSRKRRRQSDDVDEPVPVPSTVEVYEECRTCTCTDGCKPAVGQSDRNPSTPEQFTSDVTSIGSDFLQFVREDSTACVPENCNPPALPDEIRTICQNTESFNHHDNGLSSPAFAPDMTSVKRQGWIDHQYFKKTIKPSVFAALRFIIFMLLAVVKKLRSENNSLKEELKTARVELGEYKAKFSTADGAFSRSTQASRTKKSRGRYSSETESDREVLDKTDRPYRPNQSQQKKSSRKKPRQRKAAHVELDLIDVDQLVLYETEEQFFLLNEHSVAQEENADYCLGSL